MKGEVFTSLFLYPIFIYFLLALSFSLSVSTVLLLLKYSSRVDLIDYPNIRSLHTTPTPRGGGLGIFLGVIVSVSLFFLSGYRSLGTAEFVGFIFSLFLIGFVGFLEDLKGFSRITRFVFQVTASLIFVTTVGTLKYVSLPFIGAIHFGILAVPLTILWIVALANIYNFMDGIDGLAAGEAVIAGSFLAIIALLEGSQTVFLLSLLIASASIGFLVFNFPPAMIFMGDVGSTTLGFLFAALAVIGSHKGPEAIPFVTILLLLGTFIFDTVVTLVRRIFKREQWYKAHKSHYYQRAVLHGYSHKQVALVEYGISALLGISSIVYIKTSQAIQTLVIVLWLSILSCFCIWISLKKPEQASNNL